MPRLSDFDYSLPEELIAQKPLLDRTASRLLYLNKTTGEVQDHSFIDLKELLKPGDLLVFNNTRVTAVRLIGSKNTGGRVEALLLREVAPNRFECLVKPAKRLPLGTVIEFSPHLVARVDGLLSEGNRILTFEGDDVAAQLKEIGRVPLPPYIHEALDDAERYQTVLARSGGSAAAPTAALHFSRPFLDDLAQAGIEIAEVTLDVGIDTFRPVQTEELDEHVMHGERCDVSTETAEKISQCRGRVVAVGTTAVRTLESFAVGPRKVLPGTKSTRLFIKPGFPFQAVDAMLTNFHLPRTTMMVMISAFSKREFVLEAYRHAVAERYRFLSFGDSMFIA